MKNRNQNEPEFPHSYSEPYTEDDLNTVVSLPSNIVKLLRYISADDARAIAASRSSADDREMYQRVAIQMGDHPTFEAAYRAGAFGHEPQRGETVDLYHYTSRQHALRIIASGTLRTTESNVSFRRTHAGPDVVWLTTEPTPVLGHGLHGSGYDKTRVRITVRVPVSEVHEWEPWARKHLSTNRTIETLARTGGGSETWRVVEREITKDEIVYIRYMDRPDLDGGVA